VRAPRLIGLAAAITVAAALPAWGQVGIQGGYNYATASVKVDGGDVDTSNRDGWNVGVFASKGGLIGGYIGVYYSQKGFGVSDRDVKLDYVEIPVMARVQFLMLRGYAGPNFGFQVSCNREADPTPGGTAFSCNDTKTFEFGWKIGVGGQLLMFALDVAYEFGTTDVWEIDNGSIKNQVIQVMLGLGI
jgi:hypothetical protein